MHTLYISRYLSYPIMQQVSYLIRVQNTVHIHSERARTIQNRIRVLLCKLKKFFLKIFYSLIRFCTILGTYLSDYAAGSLSDDEVQTQKPNSECKFYYTNYRNATSCSCCTSWYQYLGNLIHYFKSCLMSPDPKLPVTAAAVSKKGTLKVH